MFCIIWCRQAHMEIIVENNSSLHDDDTGFQVPGPTEAHTVRQ